MFVRTTTKGVTVVEVIIGTAIFTLLTTLVIGTLVSYFSVAGDTVLKVKAVHLAREGHELMRIIRDESWDDIASESVNTPLSFDLSGAMPTISSGPETVDSTFTRTSYLRNVYRNGDDDLVASTTAGAVLDPEGRWVMVRVEWAGDSYSSQALLTNIFNE